MGSPMTRRLFGCLAMMGIGCMLILTTQSLWGMVDLSQDTESVTIQNNYDSNTTAWHMPRHRRYVALTFDDGPDASITPQLLTILRQFNTKATFFLVGHMVVKHPHMATMISANGHDIANHTWAHYRLDEMTPDQIAHQISSNTTVLRQLNIPMVPYMRPPGGRFNDYVIRSANQQGLRMVMWDVNAADYRRSNGTLPSPQWIATRVLNKTRPGSIILMHNSPATVAALPTIIKGLMAMSYQIGPLKW